MNKETQNTINDNNAIWLTSKKVHTLYSLSKQRLYRLLDAKKISSKVDKQYGAKKGARYWNRESIDLYFKSLGNGKEIQGNPNYIYNPVEKFNYPIINYEIVPQYEAIFVPASHKK